MSARRRVDVFVYGHWGWVWQPARLRCAQHLGAPSYQRVYRLEEARAVGAQVLRDKLARRLGLTRGRRFRLFAWSRNYSPSSVWKRWITRVFVNRRRWALKRGRRTRLYRGRAPCVTSNGGNAQLN